MKNEKDFIICDSPEWRRTKQKNYNTYKAKFNSKSKKYVNTKGQKAFEIKHIDRPEEIEAEENKIKSEFRGIYQGWLDE